MKPAIILLLITILMTACTQEQSTNHLVVEIPNEFKPVSLQINREDSLKQIKKIEFNENIHDSFEVRKLYALMKSLPPFPSEIMHCPMDNGLNYELIFTDQSTEVRANLHATGCQELTFNNRTYWAMEPKGKGFRTLLMQLMGVQEIDFIGRYHG